jgi:serine O-acetyltransferase
MFVGKLVYSDYRRYRAYGALHAFSVIFACQGIWASCVFRVSHGLISATRVKLFHRMARFLAAVAMKVMEILTGISIAYDADIGEGLHIAHFGNIIIGSKVRIGRNCNLSQGVTIGAGGHGSGLGVPSIGDRVFIGPNAVVVGKIAVGSDVVIGAGAVVSRSIPDRAVVVGNPSRIVWYEGSFDYVRYDGMENDLDRNNSLLLRRRACSSQKETTSVGLAEKES